MTRTGSRISRAWLRRTNICLHHWDIANWNGKLAWLESMTIYQLHIFLSAPPPLTTCKTQSMSISIFQSSHSQSSHPAPSPPRCSGQCSGGMKGRVGLAYYQSVLRRKVEESDVLPEFYLSCGELSGWERGSSPPVSLPVIHHQTTRNLNIPNNRQDKGTIPKSLQQ